MATTSGFKGETAFYRPQEALRRPWLACPSLPPQHLQKYLTHGRGTVKPVQYICTRFSVLFPHCVGISGSVPLKAHVGNHFGPHLTRNVRNLLKQLKKELL